MGELSDGGKIEVLRLLPDLVVGTFCQSNECGMVPLLGWGVVMQSSPADKLQGLLINIP